MTTMMARRGAPTGPKNRFRPKDRTRVITFTMTATGHRALARLLRQSPMSRADLLEFLVRREAGEQTEE
jgi:short subunit dehydrogenase-like uncharacterized protein